jgi:hypothetical protein
MTMQASDEYDPYTHADQLGIQIVYRRLVSANGLWVPDLRAIFLQPRMRVIHERSVLTHELGHVVLGHRTSSPRNELQADRWASRKLVKPGELRRAVAASADPGEWCLDLGVSADLLERYLLDNAS